MFRGHRIILFSALIRVRKPRFFRKNMSRISLDAHFIKTDAVRCSLNWFNVHGRVRSHTHMHLICVFLNFHRSSPFEIQNIMESEKERKEEMRSNADTRTHWKYRKTADTIVTNASGTADFAWCFSFSFSLSNRFIWFRGMRDVRSVFFSLKGGRAKSLSLIIGVHSTMVPRSKHAAPH